MTERMPNRTRSALIILFITLIIVLVILVGDLVGRISAYSKIHGMEDEDNNEYRYDNYDNKGEVDDSKDIIETTCMMSYIGGFIVTALLIIGASILFSARNSYGPKQYNKAIAVFVLSIIAPVITILFSFFFGIFDVSRTGVIVTTFISIFAIVMFLSNYEFSKGLYKYIALTLGIGSTIPLLFITKVVMDSGVRISELKTICIHLMITDIGLIVGFSFYICSFWESLRYTKANPPRADNLQLRLMNQQAQQLKMEVEILRLQKEQMEVLKDIEADRISSTGVGLLVNINEADFTADEDSYTE